MDRKSLSSGEPPHRRRTWTPIGAPQTHIHYWLKLADSRFYGEFRSRLKECNIIASEWAALRELYRPGRLSPLDLGSAIGMTKGGASKLVDRLVDKKLVRKSVGEFDRRCRAVRLSRRGRELVPFLASFEGRADARIFQRLRSNGRQRLMEALKRALGVEQQKYLDQWISIRGDAGQWVFQAAWLRGLAMVPLAGFSPAKDRSGRITVGSGKQSCQFFGG